VVQVLDITVAVLLVMVRSETWVYNERPAVTFLNFLCKRKGKGKGKGYHRRGHEGPERGGTGIALLFP
jgi:hypothetical protein